jgi:hypothetical protein
VDAEGGPLSEARRHAITASELLAGTEALSARLDAMTPEERLQMAIAGGFSRVNVDLRWTVELAIALSLAALALARTDLDIEVPA